MKRRVKWKSSYKGPGDDKSRYVKLGAAAAAVLAVLAAGSLMVSHFAGKDGTHQDGVIEILRMSLQKLHWQKKTAQKQRQ